MGNIMAGITNTNISSYDYLLRNYYSSNRTARKAVGRANFKKEELIKADSDALKKVSKNLKELEYSSDNGVNIYNNIKALVESYNNLLDSTDNTTSAKVEHEAKNLKKLLKNHAEELEEIGIKISSSGGLKIDEKTLLAAKPSKVSKILSGSDSLTTDIQKYATKINRLSKTLMQNGNGNKQAATATALPGLAEETNIMTSTSINIKA